MLKQQDMTETAAAVLHFLPADKWVTPRMMTRTTGVSEARCQLILTQLVLAVSCCENGRLVGVGSTCQPFAHAYWSQANHGPLL
ncbi:TPA: hypothetical protein KL551_001033 [Escherichia coli]|nr:hypothetical protein [Escherichia coli]